MKLNKLRKKYVPVQGDFQNLDRFDFPGVYILSDENNDVVYVGSSYARTIQERLDQYLNISDTGNSLLTAICKVDYNTTKKKTSVEDKKAAIAKIEKLKITAIPHEDLEYQLIKEAAPKYNTHGKNK